MGNVAVVVRCCCPCRAVVSSCHHGDGHASAPISVPDCECNAFQGRSVRVCVQTQQVDLLTQGFEAAPPALTSHVNANGSHRPTLTRMMDSITMAIGIPCCPGLQRSSIPKRASFLKGRRAFLLNITRSADSVQPKYNLPVCCGYKHRDVSFNTLLMQPNCLQLQMP